MLNDTLEISVLLLMILIEVILGLLLAVVVLFVLNRAKKTLLGQLLNRLSELTEKQEEASEEPLPDSTAPTKRQLISQTDRSYADYLDEALQYTKDYYQMCFGKDKIALQKTDSLDQQIIALRYTFLFAEKLLNHQDQTTPEFWQHLKTNLKRIIRAYEADEEDADPAPVVEDHGDEQARLEAENTALKQRIANLEMFKKLFFELQAKVKELTTQGEEIHEQAQAIAQASGDEKLQGLMNHYHNAYQKLGHAIGHDMTHIEKHTRVVTQVLTVNNTEELKKLKTVNNEQHNLITRLRSELMDLHTSPSEELQNKVDAIQTQVQRLQKSLSESEMCVQMLESDYQQAMDQVHALQTQIDSRVAEAVQYEIVINTLENENTELNHKITALTDHNKELTTSVNAAQDNSSLIAQFAQESKDLMSCMSTLENENEELSTQVKRLKSKLKKQRTTTVINKPGDETKLKTILAEKDKEIIRLQNEYTTLEGQYLSAFSKQNS